ncbi:MAG: DUF2842 domain-containing protein [Sphingomicrobium sp.]
MRLRPESRRLAATIGIIAIICVWVVFVASLASFVGSWPVLIQALFYLIVGIGWIFPVKPLIRWSQTGHWRDPHNG